MFELDYFVDILPRLFAAALINVQLALIIAICALVSAIGLTILRVQKIAVLNMAINLVMSFVRGTPLLVQIFLCYYVLPSIGIDLGPITAGLLAITLNSTVFIAETMRGGLQTMDPGQVEAATALGLRAHLIWGKIIVPQLILRIVPMLVNEFTVIIKGTALLSVITVVEVMRAAQQLASSSFRPFESMLGAGLVFLVVNGVFILAGMRLESGMRERIG
ncbi:amino acid ABC transporter permease [Boseaceae bacterium BT-24-1]|nr:amino acid ABC transporter permease [Boseaceae bacterium BT-24-1]